MSENIKISLKVLVLVQLIIIISLVSFLVFISFNEDDFITEYTIATNYIDSAIATQKIAEINFGYYIDYTSQEEGYYYEDASVYLDNTISELEKSQEELIISKQKLENLKGLEPNKFYEEELTLRIEQLDLAYEVSKKRLELIDINNKELYEINFGSEIKANEYYEESNRLVEEFNVVLLESIEVSNKIDIHWGENFYPN